MNKETLDLLNKLAEKLGTTSDYLWSVLINQAFVEGINNIIFIVFSLLFIYGFTKLHFKFIKENIYNKYEESAVLPMILGMMVSFCLIIGIISTLSELITYFYNPEYWALNEILKTLKSE